MFIYTFHLIYSRGGERCLRLEEEDDDDDHHHHHYDRHGRHVWCAAATGMPSIDLALLDSIVFIPTRQVANVRSKPESGFDFAHSKAEIHHEAIIGMWVV